MITRKVVYRDQGRVTVLQLPSGSPMDHPHYSNVLWPKANFNAYMTKVKTQIETRREVAGPHTVVIDGRAMRTGYAQVIKNDPRPDERYDEHLHVKKSKSVPYPPPDGAIVMNPYEKSKTSITQIPGQEILSTRGLSGVNTCFDSLGVKWFAKLQVPGESHVRHFLDARHFVWSPTGLVFVMDFEEVTSKWAMPSDEIVVPTAVALKQQVLSGCKMDSILIQSAQAEANEKFLDLTTELAELPETVKMVLDGFRTIARMVSDFKSKKFSLTKASAKRRAYLKKKLDESLASINHRRKGATKKLLHILEREKKRAQRSYKKAVAESLRELADAVANLWLQFRYGIMPVVYTVESVQDLIKSLKSEYVTTRDKESSEISIPHPVNSGEVLEIPATHRVTIKQRYKPKATTFEDVMVRMSGNFALTLWELTPLSFVVDWFINVGDLLSSLNPSAEWDEEQECYAWRISHTQRLTLTNGSTLVIEVDAYKRDLIPDDAVCGLKFDPNLTLFRLYDAIALLWNPIKSLLITSKKR